MTICHDNRVATAALVGVTITASMICCQAHSSPRESEKEGDVSNATAEALRRLREFEYVIVEDGDGQRGWSVVFLPETTCTNAALAVLQDISHLKSLHLAGASLDNRAMRHVRELTTLETLSISGTQITDEGLIHLRPLTTLKKLALRDTRITDDGLAHLRHLTSLRELELTVPRGSPHVRLSDRGLAHVGRLEQLKRLEIGSNKYSAAGLEQIESLDNLRYLGFRGYLTDAGLEHVGALKRLEELGLHASSGEFQGTGLVHLKGLRSLKRISISAQKVTGQGLSHLAQLPNLRCLALPGSGIRDSGMRAFEDLTQLRHLNLIRCRYVTDSGLQYLSNLKHLDGLVLDGTQVTDAGLAHLLPLADLKKLSLQRPHRRLGVTDKGLRHVGSLKGLQELHLDYTDTTDCGIKHLQGLGLKVLSLKGTHVTAQVVRYVETLSKLQRLDLPSQVGEDARNRLRAVMPDLMIR